MEYETRFDPAHDDRKHNPVLTFKVIRLCVETVMTPKQRLENTKVLPQLPVSWNRFFTPFASTMHILKNLWLNLLIFAI